MSHLTEQIRTGPVLAPVLTQRLLTDALVQSDWPSDAALRWPPLPVGEGSALLLRGIWKTAWGVLVTSLHVFSATNLIFVLHFIIFYTIFLFFTVKFLGLLFSVT